MKHTVYYYEALSENGKLIVDTKYVFESPFRAIARGRMWKKEHHAARVRIENADNLKVYWI
jgi:hypothetical protein